MWHLIAKRVRDVRKDVLKDVGKDIERDVGKDVPFVFKSVMENDMEDSIEVDIEEDAWYDMKENMKEDMKEDTEEDAKEGKYQDDWYSEDDVWSDDMKLNILYDDHKFSSCSDVDPFPKLIFPDYNDQNEYTDVIAETITTTDIENNVRGINSYFHDQLYGSRVWYTLDYIIRCLEALMNKCHKRNKDISKYHILFIDLLNRTDDHWTFIKNACSLREHKKIGIYIS